MNHIYKEALRITFIPLTIFACKETLRHDTFLIILDVYFKSISPLYQKGPIDENKKSVIFLSVLFELISSCNQADIAHITRSTRKSF